MYGLLLRDLIGESINGKNISVYGGALYKTG